MNYQDFKEIEVQILRQIVQLVAAIAIPFLTIQGTRIINRLLQAHDNNAMATQAEILVKAAMQTIVTPDNLESSQVEAKHYVEELMRHQFPSMPYELLDPIIEAAVHSVKQQMGCSRPVTKQETVDTPQK